MLEDSSGGILLEVCDEGVVGRVGGGIRPRRISRKEFERQLEEQRPFTRQRYEELLEAQERARERALELEAQDKLKKAEELERAAAAAQEALRALPQEVPNTFARDVEALSKALVNASSISANFNMIHRARLKAIALQRRIDEIEEDDREVMLLLG